MKRRWLLCALVSLFAALFPASVFAVTTVKGNYLENAAFMSHNYVKYSSFTTSNFEDFAGKMKNSYHVKYLFPNAGILDSTGKINNAAAELANVKGFLNSMKSFENQNPGFVFNAVAWINIDSSVTDVTNAAVRSAIVAEVKKFTSTTATGSYVSGANRTFDGVILDLEPSGNNDTLFNAYKQLMIDVKAGIGSGKLAGVTPHKYGLNSAYAWSPTYYYYMAKYVDLIVAMTYNSGSTSGAAYKTWMESQTKDILRAVSGKYWNNDAVHPEPTNGVKVFIGLPAYPSGASHNPSYENINYGAQGVDAGVTALVNDALDQSEDFFQGASVYLHTDGTGSDNYASWSTDWWWFGRYWLGAW